eukprot:TRINITY_DN4706_c0_g1_i1.p1 TRINITY_DN4706_c0_g1~~TRINITY_DN4706_c0_g1_i1.p1  ORF type:complete len:176 (+),score=40.09 TRINITY_DN4706_c0_g1_i1:58-528(+)
MLRVSKRMLCQGAYATSLKIKLRESEMNRLMEEVRLTGEYGGFVAEEVERTVTELKELYLQGSLQKQKEDKAAYEELVGRAFCYQPLNIIPDGLRAAYFNEIEPYLKYISASTSPFMTIITADAVLISAEGKVLEATGDEVFYPNTTVCTPNHEIK